MRQQSRFLEIFTKSFASKPALAAWSIAIGCLFALDFADYDTRSKEKKKKKKKNISEELVRKYEEHGKQLMEQARYRDYLLEAEKEKTKKSKRKNWF